MADHVSSNWNVFLYLLAILLPPLSVFFKRGLLAGLCIAFSCMQNLNVLRRFLDQHLSYDPRVDTWRIARLVYHLQKRTHYDSQEGLVLSRPSMPTAAYNTEPLFNTRLRECNSIP
ncbi:hypothetical protein GGX14DRAFT_567788 [Mycena pura]|uniref:Uncharacterized protein n=1 Tax=Mycena pura TaxID=153505 RepID=A0AAD6VEC3_9AGAR|nr:hypothetical protein GGX14DRAFT_567788 [Mycena pura]